MSEDNINLSTEEVSLATEAEDTKSESAECEAEDNPSVGEAVNSDETSVEPEKKEKRMSNFTKAFLIYTAALFAVVLAVLVFFWDYMAAYEKSLPETAVNGYISSLDESMWVDILSDDITFTTNEFESSESITNKIAALLAQSDVSFVKNYDTYTDENPAYSLTRDGKKFADVVLKSGIDVGFGFTSWEVDSCDAIKEAFALESFTVTISVPDGAEAKINGIKVDESYITESGAESAQTSKYDAYYDGRLKCDIYTIDGFYFAPDVSSILNGQSLAVSSEGTAYSFAYPGDVFNSITITAPSNSVLTVNGVKVDETPKDIADIIGGVFENNLSGFISMNTYVIDGLVSDPEISCMINGVEVSAVASENGVAFDYPAELLYNIRVMVPLGASVTVNGIELTKDFFKETAIYDSFDNKSFANWLADYPECEVCEVSGLYIKPEIKVMYNGVELGIEDETDANYCVYVSEFPSSADIPDDIAARAIGFSRAFMYYTSCGYYNIDVNLQAALSYTLTGSDAYTNIKNSRIGVYYNDYYDLTYNKLEAVSYVKYTDDCITLKLDFDVDRNIYQYTNHEEGSYNITMIRSGNTWYVAEFTMVTVTE